MDYARIPLLVGASSNYKWQLRSLVLAVLNTDIRRYFKIARQRFAVDDTNMLVLWIEHQTISSRYRNIEVFKQCFHIDGCLTIEWYDILDRTIYRPSIVWSFDTLYIVVSRYHGVSISNTHKYRDTLIYRVSNQHYLPSIWHVCLGKQTSHAGGKCVTCCELHNSEINHASI